MEGDPTGSWQAWSAQASSPRLCWRIGLLTDSRTRTASDCGDGEVRPQIARHAATWYMAAAWACVSVGGGAATLSWISISPASSGSGPELPSRHS